MFYADCIPTAIIGPPGAVCDCCTHCCDIVQKNCTSPVPVVDVTDGVVLLVNGPDDGLVYG